MFHFQIDDNVKKLLKSDCSAEHCSTHNDIPLDLSIANMIVYEPFDVNLSEVLVTTQTEDSGKIESSDIGIEHHKSDDDEDFLGFGLESIKQEDSFSTTDSESD